MKKVVVIPARLNSKRFPNKILFDLKGLPMIEHVRRRALLAKNVEEVYIATCDIEIRDVLEGYGAEVIMTSKNHKNGTTRVAEAVSNINCSNVILIQGDEPLLLPRHLDKMINTISHDNSSFARDCVRPFIPNLEATYAELLDEPLLPARLEILIIVALDFITLEAALQPQKAPFKLVSKISLKNVSSISEIGFQNENPALLTYTSNLPYFSMASWTKS